MEEKRRHQYRREHSGTSENQIRIAAGALFLILLLPPSLKVVYMENTAKIFLLCQNIFERWKKNRWSHWKN